MRLSSNTVTLQQTQFYSVYSPFWGDERWARLLYSTVLHADVQMKHNSRQEIPAVWLLSNAYKDGSVTATGLLVYLYSCSPPTQHLPARQTPPSACLVTGPQQLLSQD